MHFLDTLFNRSINSTRRTLNKRSLNKRTKTLSLETLEQRIALDASGVRSQLEPVREVHIDNSLVGPDPIVFGKSELIGHNTRSFVITSVAAGSTVEKLDVSTNQWRNVSAPITTSNPSELIRLMRLRVIQEGDQIRWLPKSTDGVTQKAFGIIGWDDGSEASEPEGVNVPGAVENLEIELVGDEVQVTWDAPTSGAAVTHYRIHQNPTTILPSTQRSHTFTKAASPASYSVTLTANSASGAGETTSAYYSEGIYQKIIGGTQGNPILKEVSPILDINTDKAHRFTTKIGPAFYDASKNPGIDLSHANMDAADLRYNDLTNANLSHTFLANADLIGANLRGANLEQTFLDIANLYWVQSGDITGTPAVLPKQVDSYSGNLVEWKLINGYLIGPLADLTGANLAGADLTGALLNGKLTGANLADAILTNAIVEPWKGLNGVRSGGIVGELAGPMPHGWELHYGYIFGPYVDLSKEDLSGLNLHGLNLNHANLTGVDLTNTDLNNANLDGVVSGNIIGEPASLPSNFDLINGWLIGPGVTLRASDNNSDVNLSNTDLSNIDLNNADLATATLKGVRSGNISGTPKALPSNWRLIDGYLIGPGANLTGADLTGADLSGADLSKANLSNAILSNANLADVNLSGARSGGIIGTPSALPSNCQLVDGYLVMPGVISPGADLTGADLMAADLTGADLTNINFTGADLTDAILTGTDLTGTDLTNATLNMVQSGGITGTPHALPQDWQLINDYLVGPGADLTGANLTGASLELAPLQGATLTNANLTHANLFHADLTNADLRGAILDNSNLWNATLTNAVLINAELTDVSLLDADLTNADFTGVTLSGDVYFTNTQLSGVSSGGMTGTPSMLPTDWKFTNGYLVGPNADLTGANLAGADLAGADLTAANLTEVQSGGITGTPHALPQDWQFIEGFLFGPGADLTGANLTGKDLSSVNLFAATLTNANLTNTNLGSGLTGAELSMVKSGGIQGVPQSMPIGWQLIDGYLISGDANLTDAVLTNADLSDVNLSYAVLIDAHLDHANVKNADLSNATLTGVSSGGIKGTPAALPTDWQLTNGYLIGPDANLTGAVLSNLDLSGKNLSDVVLSDAYLNGANLNNADLSNATLTGVSSGGIKGTPAALPTNWRLIDGYLIGPGANLTGADLTGADLTNADLTNADLNGANLNGANLTGTNFTGANLDDAILNGAHLDGAKLAANLYGVQSAGFTGTPASLPTHWHVVSNSTGVQSLVGPGANLAGQNLHGVDLTNANLTGTNFTGANLDDAILNGAHLDGAKLAANLYGVQSAGFTGTPASLPTHWHVVSNSTGVQSLVGPGANLVGQNLHGVDLTSQDLTGTALMGSDLTDATLTGVTGAAKYNTATILPAGFDPVAAGWTLVG